MSPRKNGSNQERFFGSVRFRRVMKIDGSKQECSTLLEVSIVAIGLIGALVAFASWAIDHWSR